MGQFDRYDCADKVYMIAKRKSVVIISSFSDTCRSAVFSAWTGSPLDRALAYKAFQPEAQIVNTLINSQLSGVVGVV